MSSQPQNLSLVIAQLRAQQALDELKEIGDATRQMSQGAMQAILSRERSGRREKLPLHELGACPQRDPSVPCTTLPAALDVDACGPGHTQGSASQPVADSKRLPRALAGLAVLTALAVLAAWFGEKR